MLSIQSTKQMAIAKAIERVIENQIIYLFTYLRIYIRQQDYQDLKKGKSFVLSNTDDVKFNILKCILSLWYHWRI